MKFEVPFTGQYNTRVAASYPVAKDERYINCYLTKEGAKNYIQKRPGFATDSTPSAGNIGSALTIWTGYGSGSTVYKLSAFGATNSTIYVNATSLGAITGKARNITEVGGVGTSSVVIIASSDSTAWLVTGQNVADQGQLTFTGDTHTNTTIDNISAGDIATLSVGQLISGSGIAASTRIATIGASSITTTIATTATAAGVTITRETLAKVIDTDYPGASITTVGGFVVLDGYVCIMTLTGRIYASDLNSGSAWTSNSYDTASEHPDYGVGLALYKNEYIMAFGKDSIEFWYNDGLTPFPLRRNGTMTQSIGAISADAIAQLADSVFWCGPTEKGGLSIFQYDGNVSRISNPEIDFQLLICGASAISMTTLRAVGKSFVIVNTTSTTYVYVIEDKRWHEWTGDAYLWYKATGATVSSTNLTYTISGTSTSGKIYKIDPDSQVYTDDSAAFTATAQSGNMDRGGDWMFFNFLRVIADKEASTSTLTILASDDDYGTFTTLGTVDLSSMNTRIERLGASQKRAWKITHASATPMRIEKLVGEMEVGT